MSQISPEELQKLVSAAVQQALKQRKLSGADLQQILHGPITIGLIAQQPAPKPGGVAASPGIHDQRLIGFVAQNLEQLRSAIKSE